MRYRLPLTASKKGKASDNNGIRAEDIKTCDETTKEIDKTDLQRSDEARGLHTRNMENNTFQGDLQKMEMWKKSVISVRFALRQRFTNCSQHSCTTDFTTDLSVRNQRTREGFDVHTKRLIILQHTDCWNTNAGSVDRDSGLYQGI